MVVSAAAGYHGSVCAYGQTATGKTYTMAGTNRHPGLMPLAVREATYMRNLVVGNFRIRKDEEQSGNEKYE